MSYDTSVKLNLSKVRERSKGYVSSKEALRGIVRYSWRQTSQNEKKGIATGKVSEKDVQSERYHSD